MARASGGSGVGLSPCGGDGRAAWPADADAARIGARLLHRRRYSARYRGDAGHAARRDDLAREHRAVDCRLAHHDAGDVELPAHRAPLGSIVGADGGKSGLDGPSHRAVERTGRRPARHCYRADCARSPARRRPAERTGAVRTGGTGGGAGAGACRLLRARSDAAARGGGDRLCCDVLPVAISGRVIVRRHGGLRTPARHGRHPCGAALVARLKRGDRAGRSRRLALCRHELPHVARLSGRRVRVIRGGDDRRNVVRLPGTAFLLVPDRQRRDRVCARRTGYDDGAGIGAAPRSGLCRCAPPGALSGRHICAGGRRAPARPQKSEIKRESARN